MKPRRLTLALLSATCAASLAAPTFAAAGTTPDTEPATTQPEPGQDAAPETTEAEPTSTTSTPAADASTTTLPDSTTATTAPASTASASTAPASTSPTTNSTVPVPVRPVLTATRWDGIFAPGVAVAAVVESADPALFQPTATSTATDTGFVEATEALKAVRGDLPAAMAKILTAHGTPGDAVPASVDAWLARYDRAMTQGLPPVLPAQDPATPLIRPIAFPVLGPTTFYNDWQACRDNCDRHHEGTDLIGPKGQPLRAAVDGVVTDIHFDSGTIAGTYIEVTAPDGWLYLYRHVNNDTPGTNDGRAAAQWAVQPGIEVGTFVHAGQIIGYVGNSGNAEASVPHLHFEIRTPERISVNPYPSLLAARQREQGMVGVGAWSTLHPAAGSLLIERESLWGATPAEQPIVFGDGLWQIGADGTVLAYGPGALVAPAAGGVGPAQPAGSGISFGQVPKSWITPLPAATTTLRIR